LNSTNGRNKMKVSTNKKELTTLCACKKGFDIFVDAYGDNEAMFSQCLESNDWEDVWWLIHKIYTELTIEQINSLHLLGCHWAEKTLINFESAFPDDNRPRLAIAAKRDFINGNISLEDLNKAHSAAFAASSAADSADSASSAAAYSAYSAHSASFAAYAAEYAASDSAEYAARSEQKQDLMELFLIWEVKQ